MNSSSKTTTTKVQYIHLWSICLFFCLIWGNTSIYAQTPIVTGYADSRFEGGSDKLNKTGTFCHYNGPNGPFANDTYSSMKVKSGYYVWIAEHCNDGRPGGDKKAIIGNVADFGALWGDDKQWWHDRVSAINIQKLSESDMQSKVKAGVTQMYNPYRNSYVRSGMQAGTDERVETTNENFKYNSQNKPEENEFWFAFIKNKEGDYYIFNTASGKALMPEGADTPDFGQIKPGTKLSSYEFGGQEEWATFKITSIGLDRYTISPKSNHRLVLTMSPNSSNGELTFEVNTMEAGQQFYIGNYKMEFGDKVSPPEINKNAPVKEKYSLLEYSGAGESSPHKEISVKVPFYMVKDPEIKDFYKKMNTSRYYTLERVEFVKSKTKGNEWKYNRSNSDLSFSNFEEETNTSGSDSGVSVNSGVEQSVTVEASSLFLTASATTTFSLNLGFSHNWYKEYSKTIGISTDMTLKPCSKGKLYALANRITLKRQDGSIVKSFVMYKEGSEQFTSVALAPDECLDLGKKEYEDAKYRYERYNKLTSPTTEKNNANTHTTSVSTSNSTSVATPTPTWNNLKNITGKDIAIDSNGNPWIINSNNDIYHHNGTSWQQYSGGGKGIAIAVAPDNTPWVIGTDNQVWKGTGSSWVVIGGKKGKDIAIDSNGNPWIINSNNGIYHHNGTSWQQYSGGGSGIAIAVAPDNTPWVIGTDNQVWKGTGSSWVVIGGKKGKDIAINSNGNPWIINSSNGIYHHNGANWQQYSGGGSGITIAVAPDKTPSVIGTDNQVWKGTSSR